MKAVRLNLEDRHAWQKFQNVLTSFASDYIDLVAAEQTEFKFEQQVLSLAFTLIAVTPDRARLNQFTQSLERYFGRLQLLGVRHVVFEFYAVGEDVPMLSHGFDVSFVPAPQPSSAITQSTAQALAGGQTASTKGGNLVQRLRGWLVDPRRLQTVQTTGRLAVRDPKGFFAAAKNTVVTSLTNTIDWVDTFPWESWFQSKVQWQKRRHRRNLWKALLEDSFFIVVLAIALWWATDYLSGPTINLATMPDQHYDLALDMPKYRCGNPGVSLKNYVCLQRGMDYDRVANILGGEGKPLGIDRKFGDRAVIINWTSGNLNMNATFLDNKLVSRAYRKIDDRVAKR